MKLKIRKTNRNNKGITLIALIVTIIVLLILAGVSIVMLLGDNGILNQASRAKEETKKVTAREEIELLVQEAHINEQVDGVNKIENLKNKLTKKGAEQLWYFETYQKEYWKYDDVIIIMYPNRYEIKDSLNTLVNNEGNNSDTGFLIDVAQGGIARKDIKSIEFSNEIPESYTTSYDVSESKNNSIVLYAIKENDKYNVTIVSKDIIYAPEYSARLFGDLSNVENINLNGLDTSQVTNMYVMFTGDKMLQNLDLTAFDTNNVTNITAMFRNCSNLDNINLSSFDTSNVTEMQTMFYGCGKLLELDLSGFNTSKVTKMSSMFSNCKSLTNIVLSSNFNTTNVIDMQYMFSQCNNLQEVDLSGFNTENVSNMSCMFMGCENLNELNLTSFNTNKVEKCSGMFSSCKNLTAIYVSNMLDVTNTENDNMFWRCGVNKVELI